jgi:hypothetical protein
MTRRRGLLTLPCRPRGRRSTQPRLTRLGVVDALFVSLLIAVALLCAGLSFAAVVALWRGPVVTGDRAAAVASSDQ